MLEGAPLCRFPTLTLHFLTLIQMFFDPENLPNIVSDRNKGIYPNSTPWVMVLSGQSLVTETHLKSEMF